MPTINITGKPATNAAGGSSFAGGIIRNNAAPIGATTPAAGSAGTSQGLNAATSFATAGIRRMGSAANNATAALTAFQRKLNSLNLGRGGGGGGSGGGGGGSGGGGRGSNTPRTPPMPKSFWQKFAAGNRMNGVGHILQQIGGYGGVGTATGIIGTALMNPEILPEIALAGIALSPQISQVLNNAFQGATQSYRVPALQAYNYARAGGYNGQGMVDFFRNPNSNKSLLSQFAAVGLGPQDAMNLQSQFGIGSTSQSGFLNNILSLGAMSTNSTLGDMNQGQLIAAQSSMVGMGIGSVNQNTSAISDLLANAYTKGLDKSVLLTSMTTSLTSLATAGGLGVNANSAASFISSYANTGTAGGRNGSAAASVQAGLQNLAANSLSSPFSSAISNKLAGQFQSMSDFKSKAPMIYAMMNDGNHPLLKQQITDYLSAPRPFQAAGIGSILQNDMNTYYSATSGVVTSIAGGGLPGVLATSNAVGTSAGNIYIANSAAQLAASGPLSKIKDPAQRATLYAAAAKYGVDPNVLAAQYGIENSYGANIGKNPRSTARGYFQFIDGTWKDYGSFNRNDFGASVNAAAHYDSDLFNKYDEQAGLDHYGGAGYAAKIAGMGIPLSGQVSAGQQAILNQNSSAGFSDFTGAAATFTEFDGSVSNFTKAVNMFVNAVMGAPGIPKGKGQFLNGAMFGGHG